MHTPPSVFSGAEIDYSNPFVSGLVYAVLVRNGSLINMLDKATVPILTDGIITTNETGQVVRNDVGDVGAGINAGLNTRFNTAVDNKIFSTYTKATVVDITGTFVSSWHQSNIRKFRMRIVPSFNLLLEFGADDFPLGSFFNIPDLRVGIGLTADGSTGTAYRNGLQNGNIVDISTTIPPAGDTLLGVGCNFTNPPTVTNALRSADLDISLGWDRALTAEEQLIINNDPWQIFKPLNRIFTFAGVAAGPVTGTGVLVSGPSQIDSTGFKTAIATGVLVSGPSQLDSTGFKTAIATGALVSGNSSLQGVGTRVGTATGTLVSGPSQLDSTGFKTAIANGVLISGPSQINGAGGPPAAGVGNLVSGPSQLASTGFKTAIGNGVLVSGPSQIDGMGGVPGGGVGNLVSGPSQINGFGFRVTPVVSPDRSQSFIYYERQQNFIYNARQQNYTEG